MRPVLYLVLVTVAGFAAGAGIAHAVGPELSVVALVLLSFVLAGSLVVLIYDVIARQLERRRRRIPAPAQYLARNRGGRR